MHHSLKLQRAWNKYGIENFWFQFIEKVSPDRCIEREQYWLDVFQSVKHGYNIAHIAGSNKGLKYTLTKSRNPCSDNAKKLLSSYYKGVPKSKEAAKKSGLGHLRPIVQLDLNGVFIAEWPGIRPAVIALKFTSNKISECCQGKKYISSKGFKWMYKSDYYGSS